MPDGTDTNAEHREAPANWRYMTLSQVSQKLGGRSRSSLYRDIEAGRLPNPIKLGRRCYFRETEIDEAMAQVEECNHTDQRAL